MPAVATAIVGKLVRMDKAAQREWFERILSYLARESGSEVESLHDFITAPPSDSLPEWRRDQLLATVAKAVREDDPTALQ